MSTGLTPKQVAVQLDVHANTVRLWCSEFADVLSDSARGRPRLFTPPDVAILQRIKEMRSEGLTRSEVLERLRQTPTADLQTPYIDAAPATPDKPTETPTAPLVAMDVTSALSALLESTRSAATQEDVRRIDERLHKLETQRLIYIGAAAGLVAGVALGVIVALLLLRQ